ncbi:MAG: DUF1028 domain-containing protein [Bacteroidetes bacterium]|nr:DUF1028 domain-containing protein [Bacteroidota bacterium]MBU2506234.1 DUF1028 domain-containing protein [Bacteroidota bacterium]
MKTKLFIVVLSIIFSSQAFSQKIFSSDPFCHTYSIVARDTHTGEMGVAVQSHWYSVGTIVSWAEAGAGAIATQSFVNVSFGPRGLEMLRNGSSAQETLDKLINDDEARDVRQLAIVDKSGNVAAWTGKLCIAEAGHKTGAGFSVHANMMLNNTVWDAMYSAFKISKGPLAERLLTALKAAESEGGDIRGRQSASLIVVKGESTGKPWEDKLVDLRVDDSSEPLIELERLLKVHRAYEHMNAGDLAVEKGNMKLAMDEYSAAENMFPDNEEMKYWHAVTLANNGSVQESLPLFKEVFVKNNNWKILTTRLPKVNLLNVSESDLQKILAAAEN